MEGNGTGRDGMGGRDGTGEMGGGRRLSDLYGNQVKFFLRYGLASCCNTQADP